ncbi:putative dimethylaniline monooxygenase (N-oxide-forming) [Suillus lakei]|nr:putative dimethylaniline monooxygenase (N-oxide-forming) [Suillus lakei]
MSGSSKLSTPLSAEVISSTWLCALVSDLSRPTFSLKNSFTDDGYWRDLLAFTPDFRTVHTLPKIQRVFSIPVADARPSQFRVLPGVRQRRTGPAKAFIQGIIQFQTTIAECTGVFTLVQSDDSWKAWSFVTMMDRLLGVTDRIDASQTPLCCPPEWKTVMEYTAVIVGAAVLGDSWRSRYEALETNTPRAFNHLPFVPFPDKCGEHIPSTDVADYLENYQKILGLHVLTSACVSDASYDFLSGTWTVSVSLSDRSFMTVTARHLIAATVPFIPSIPGKTSFLGTILHSNEYTSSRCGSARKAVVIGAGCSAHDIAQDLTNNGSRTVLVQRSPTAVVSRQAMGRSFTGYFGQDILPTDIADQNNAHIDRDLRDDLSRHGYLLPGPEDNFLHRLIIRRGGYYIDRGCAKLITSGQIAIKSGHDISCFIPSGLVFDDGSRVEADLVIFATGYLNTTIKQVAESLFGPKVADAVHDLGAWDSDLELAGIWRPSGHKGLWFVEGDLFAARFYSQLLALQIKTREMKLLGPDESTYILS